jgi:hypothetical protein
VVVGAEMRGEVSEIWGRIPENLLSGPKERVDFVDENDCGLDFHGQSEHWKRIFGLILREFRDK